VKALNTSFVPFDLSCSILECGQPPRRANDSQTPPLIKTAPEMRPSNLVRAGFKSQVRP
jgi:hypothetical protein